MGDRLLSCRVPAEQAGRADRVVQALTGVSRAWVRGLFDDDRVSINGRPAPDAAELVAEGDTVDVRFDPHTRCHARPRQRIDPAFHVLFEDEHVIVVDKAAFVLTVPTDKLERDTLVDRVARHLGRGGRERRPHVVQRLDRGTSGVLIFAVTRPAAVELIRQFRRHEPIREYVALLAGSLREDRGTIQTRLATNRSLSRYTVRGDQDGELAVTHFEVEARYPGATQVRVRLETGRRNQIRVHFAEAGHPVLGDPRYAPERATHPRWRARRLALHAAVLGLAHPVTGEELWFESALPEEFLAFERAPRPGGGRTRL